MLSAFLWDHCSCLSVYPHQLLRHWRLLHHRVETRLHVHHIHHSFPVQPQYPLVGNCLVSQCPLHRSSIAPEKNERDKGDEPNNTADCCDDEASWYSEGAAAVVALAFADVEATFAH